MNAMIHVQVQRSAVRQDAGEARRAPTSRQGAMKAQVRVDLETLREQVPVPALLTAHGIELHRGTRLACPICGATNPTAFSFDDTRWHCFRCGRGGDVFSLAMELRRCGFREAIGVIGGIAGIGTGQIPTLEAREVERRLKLKQRRGALRKWRDRRLLGLAAELYELDRDIELISGLLIRLRHERDPASADGLWALFEDSCSARDEAEWVACQLEQDDEHEWARLWLLERPGPSTRVLD